MQDINCNPKNARVATSVSEKKIGVTTKITG